MIVSWFRVLIFSLILTTFLPVLSGGPFAVSPAMADEAEYFTNKGDDAFKVANNEEALYWYGKAAERGSAKAHYMLGKMFEKGWGVAKDDVEAARWFRLADKYGHPSASIALEEMQIKDPGKIAKDNNSKGNLAYLAGNYEKAVHWYHMAAEQGYARSQDRLGFMYQHGKGVTKDPAEALRWYHKAAEQGFGHAQTELGTMYIAGEVVRQDDAEAFRWYRKAAEQGNANGQLALGIMYERGRGVTKDKAEAARWYRKAIEQGSDKAQSLLDKMLK